MSGLSHKHNPQLLSTLACAFLISLLISETSNAAEAAPEVEVEVEAEITLKPRLCIRGTENEMCEITIKLQWQGNIDGEYCIFRENLATAVKCWKQVRQGDIKDSIRIEQDLQYWLVWQATANELDRKVLTLFTAKPDDRRKSRRRRHSWSVF